MNNAFQTTPLLSVNAEQYQLLMSSKNGKELLNIFNSNSLTAFFQPIIDVKNQSIFAHEALIRGPLDSPLHNPLDLFKTAEDHEFLFEMDWLARLKSIQSYQSQNGQNMLFLNVTVNSILQKTHKSGITLEYLQFLGIPIEKVVIEITELQPIEDFYSFIDAVNHYREMGFKVAIDDLGAGYNGLRIWSEINPDFVKIDHHFIKNIHIDVNKYRFMETITQLARGLKTKIIAEGVENKLELMILEKLGVDYVQGFLFSKPQALLVEAVDFNWRPHSRFSTPVINASETVASLSQPCYVVEPDSKILSASDYLLSNPHVDFIPVILNGIVHGMLWRREIMNLLAKRFGRDLYQSRLIRDIMDPSPIIVEFNTPLVKLSELITESQNSHRGDAFIVTNNDSYDGAGHFIDVLRLMTELKVQSAQYSNPLSGLPGNVPIKNTMESFLKKQIEFSVIYVDVDHFKPYNDCYSYEQGDMVIQLISAILQQLTNAESDFIGHIGGDDFIIVLPDIHRYNSVCFNILELFSEKIQQFYNQHDLRIGGILAKNRVGEETYFPIMSLSLGVLVVHPNKITHQQQLASLATLAKKNAKLAGGNTYAVVNTLEFDMTN